MPHTRQPPPDNSAPRPTINGLPAVSIAMAAGQVSAFPARTGSAIEAVALLSPGFRPRPRSMQASRRQVASDSR